jgi:hypothetical protein
MSTTPESTDPAVLASGPAESTLPSPAELGRRDASEKITIVLSQRSVAFFRREAERHGTHYQRMIRTLLDRYVDAWSGTPPTP